MTTDLWMLVSTAILCLSLPNVSLFARITTPGGKEFGFGNREKKLENAPAWSDRSERAHLNLVENIGVFAALVLVAHVAGKSNDVTALGATIFFAARIAHAATYILGIKYVRTITFLISVAGMVTIFTQLF